ncbi:hypothetical protein MN608_04246 [Microdochium nivale]|nr:hypothetical protein MN608_04246 [Microdochium nivale]
MEKKEKYESSPTGSQAGVDGPPVYDGAMPQRRTSDADPGDITTHTGQLHRRLDNRQIQLIAIGGSIGTALFVSIRSGLRGGGPASLLIAYVGYSIVVAGINNCMAEMGVLQPVSGGFIRMAGKWVDDAFGFMAGWNFFLYEALLIPFEITALNVVLSFWRDDIPAAAVICVCILMYAGLNVVAVRVYGEAEFWLSGGKVILLFMLFGFTLVTMAGGNPQHDAYGFRNWSDPGAFVEYTANGATGHLARFEGLLTAVWSAAFAVVGPEYIAMVAAEAKRPTIYIKTAYKTVYIRFGLFFMMSALCVGIVVPSNDPGLSGNGGTAAGSPYVIAMSNMGIKILPDITNALMLTSIFSAGNTYTYAATRSLYGLSVDGRAPRFLSYCTKNGVPIWCFCIVMLFPLLSFLQLGGDSSNKVLDILLGLITGGGIINYLVISVTYIFFYRATQAQGVDRKSFPYTGWLQPWCGYLGIVVESLILLFIGYGSVATWELQTFFTYYTMLFLAIILFVGWKVVHRTKFVSPHEADLVWERPAVEAYEAALADPPTGFWEEMGHLVGIRKSKTHSAA